MSRYAIITDQDNLEIFLGFDDGLGGFFLTIEDVTKSDGEPESFVFHNMVHHPEVGLTYEDLGRTLVGFGIHLPADLTLSLAAEAGQESRKTPEQSADRATVESSALVQVTGWHRID